MHLLSPLTWQALLIGEKVERFCTPEKFAQVLCDSLEPTWPRFEAVGDGQHPIIHHSPAAPPVPVYMKRKAFATTSGDTSSSSRCVFEPNGASHVSWAGRRTQGMHWLSPSPRASKSKLCSCLEAGWSTRIESDRLTTKASIPVLEAMKVLPGFQGGWC